MIWLHLHTLIWLHGFCYVGWIVTLRLLPGCYERCLRCGYAHGYVTVAVAVVRIAGYGCVTFVVTVGSRVYAFGYGYYTVRCWFGYLHVTVPGCCDLLRPVPVILRLRYAHTRLRVVVMPALQFTRLPLVGLLRLRFATHTR